MGKFKLLVSRAQVPALVSHAMSVASGGINGQINVEYSSISTAGESSDRSHEQVVSFETQNGFLLKRVSSQEPKQSHRAWCCNFFLLDLIRHALAC